MFRVQDFGCFSGYLLWAWQRDPCYFVVGFTESLFQTISSVYAFRGPDVLPIMPCVSTHAGAIVIVKQRLFRNQCLRRVLWVPRLGCGVLGGEPFGRSRFWSFVRFRGSGIDDFLFSVLALEFRISGRV